jgi:type I restriction enzyme M protein
VIEAGLSAAKKTLKELKAAFIERLEGTVTALSEEDCRRLALGIAREDLEAQLDRYIATHRREVVAAVETWWDKYWVSIREIEAERDVLAKELERFVGELGYAR